MQTYVKQYIYVYVFKKKKKTRVMFDRHMSEKQLHNGVFWVFSRFYRYRTVFVYVSRQPCQIDRYINENRSCVLRFEKRYDRYITVIRSGISVKNGYKKHISHLNDKEVGLPDYYVRLPAPGWLRALASCAC